MPVTCHSTAQIKLTDNCCAYDILPYNYISSKLQADLFFRLLDVLQAWNGKWGGVGQITERMSVQQNSGAIMLEGEKREGKWFRIGSYKKKQI